jgi:ribose 1,5-bisphosphokinase PhnN
LAKKYINGSYIDETQEEINQRLARQQQVEEQEDLDKLKPTEQKVEQAEFELKTLTLLQEVGLIE